MPHSYQTAAMEGMQTKHALRKINDECMMSRFSEQKCELIRWCDNGKDLQTPMRKTNKMFGISEGIRK